MPQILLEKLKVSIEKVKKVLTKTEEIKKELEKTPVEKPKK